MKKIKAVIDQYNNTNINEITNIQAAYKKHCLKLEQASQPNTLQWLRSNISADYQYPIFFEMQENFALPVVYDRGFAPSRDKEAWRKKLTKCPIKLELFNIIETICEYQVERANRSFFSKGYNYDPTNLFFEEFKHWIIEVSKCQLNDELIKSIEARVHYLNELLNGQVFTPGKNELNRNETLFTIQDLIKDSLIPKIQVILSEQSIRERIEALNAQLLNCCRDGLEFLFRLPQSEYMEHITFNNLGSSGSKVYEKMSATTVGQLIQQVRDSLAYTALFDPKKPEEKEINIEIHKYQAQSQPLQIEHTSWHNSEKSGICHFLCTAEFAKNYKDCCRTLVRIAHFAFICTKLYNLSGALGNIGLAYGLSSSIDKILQAGTRDLLAFTSQVNVLYIPNQIENTGFKV